VTTPTPVYSRSNDIVETEMDGLAILLHTGNWRYYTFDQVGTSIWKSLAKPSSLHDLVEDLVTQYNVDRKQCEFDTESFLNEMIEQGVVVRDCG
jgi:hypothetical protein